jgi:hypothetical protein
MAALHRPPKFGFQTKKPLGESSGNIFTAFRRSMIHLAVILDCRISIARGESLPQQRPEPIHFYTVRY